MNRAASRRALRLFAAALVALLAAWVLLAGEASAQEAAGAPPENPNEKWEEDGTMGEPIGPGDPAPAPPGPIGPPTVGDTASGPSDARTSLMSHAPVAPGAVVGNGTVSLGVFNLGHLNYSGTGVRHEPNQADALIPGCPCEGWGIANAKIPSDKGYANRAAGTRGLVAESFEVDAARGTAVSTVRAGNSFEVTHAYRPSSETKNLYAVTVTVKNTSGASVDARYRRVMDWDVPPNVFSEYVTNEDGDSPAVVYMSDNGFASADPTAGKSRMYREGDMKDAGPGDIGALFDFALGEIAPGAEKSFMVYYGAGPVEATMLGAFSVACWAWKHRSSR